MMVPKIYEGTIASKINVTPQRCQIVRKTAVNSSTLAVMTFDRNNKFDLYYGQVNSLRLK